MQRIAVLALVCAACVPADDTDDIDDAEPRSAIVDELRPSGDTLTEDEAWQELERLQRDGVKRRLAALDPQTRDAVTVELARRSIDPGKPSVRLTTLGTPSRIGGMGLSVRAPGLDLPAKTRADCRCITSGAGEARPRPSCSSGACTGTDASSQDVGSTRRGQAASIEKPPGVAEAVCTATCRRPPASSSVARRASLTEARLLASKRPRGCSTCTVPASRSSLSVVADDPLLKAAQRTPTARRMIPGEAAIISIL